MNPEKPSREEIEARLTALLLGELPAEEAQLLRWAISQDAALAQMHDELKLAIELVREVAATPAETIPAQNAPLKLSNERREKLLAHFKTVALREFVPLVPPLKKRREISPLIAMAAAIALIAVLAAMLLPALASAKRKARNITMLSASEKQIKFANDDYIVDQNSPAAATPMATPPPVAAISAPEPILVPPAEIVLPQVQNSLAAENEKLAAATPAQTEFFSSSDVAVATTFGRATQMRASDIDAIVPGYAINGNNSAAATGSTTTSPLQMRAQTTLTTTGGTSDGAQRASELAGHQLQPSSGVNLAWQDNAVDTSAEKSAAATVGNNGGGNGGGAAGVARAAGRGGRGGAGGGGGGFGGGGRGGGGVVMSPAAPTTGDAWQAPTLATAPAVAPPTQVGAYTTLNGLNGYVDVSAQSNPDAVQSLPNYTFGNKANAVTENGLTRDDVSGTKFLFGAGQLTVAQNQPVDQRRFYRTPAPNAAAEKPPMLGDVPEVGRLFQSESSLTKQDGEIAARYQLSGDIGSPQNIGEADRKSTTFSGGMVNNGTLALNGANSFNGGIRVNGDNLAVAKDENGNKALGFDWYLGNFENRGVVASGGSAPSFDTPVSAANPLGRFPASTAANQVAGSSSDQLITSGLRNSVPAPIVAPPASAAAPTEAMARLRVESEQQLQARRAGGPVVNNPVQASAIQPGQQVINFGGEVINNPNSVSSMPAPVVAPLAPNYQNQAAIRQGYVQLTPPGAVSQATAQELESKNLQLKYANPADIQSAIQQNSLTDSRSKVTVNSRTGELAISGTPQDIQLAENLVRQLDTPTRQVLVENGLVSIAATNAVAVGGGVFAGGGLHLITTPIPNGGTNMVYTSAGRQVIESKLDRIRMDAMFDSLPLSEVIQRLSDQVKVRDPDKKGINFLLNNNGTQAATGVVDPTTGLPPSAGNGAAGDIRQAVVSLNPGLTDVRLADLLDAIVQTSDHPIQYSVQDNAIVFSPKSPDAPQLYTRTFKIDPNKFYQGLQSVTTFSFGSANSNGGGGLHLVTAPDTTEGVSTVARNFFGSLGVDLTNSGKSVFFNDRLGQLFVRGTEQDLDTVQQAVQMIASSRAPASVATDIPLPKTPSPAPIPQPEILASENAFSTFSLNVSDVSFKLAAASLEKGQLPDAASIRSEEFINAFNYHDPEPAAGVPMAFVAERARDPFAHNRDLLRFSVKTAAEGREAGRPLNIVLLLDNSGSMERADRVAIIYEALKVLAAQLQPQDTLSIVTFARTARLWVDGARGDQAGTAVNQVSDLTPEGGTNLEEAMNLAYATARRHYFANGVNRVVLLTDGAANLGNVNPEALKQKVESFRKQGIALDCFGIGWEGYNDDLLEVLSSNGDGRYGFINTPEAATTEFAAQLAGALHVAAEDVKVQVEFNPQRVISWRQIGYAKHQLTKEQFRDNTVAAAPMAAREAGNALYTVEVNPQGEGPLATVRVRFRVPGAQEVSEHEWEVPFDGAAPALEKSSPALRLAATASAFSEWLAQSQFAQEVTTDRLLNYLNGVPAIYGADARPKQLETMIREAKSLSGK